MKTPNLTPQRLNWEEMTTTWKIEDLNNWTLYISRYMCDAILFPVLWQGLWQKNYFQSPHWILMPLIIETTGCKEKQSTCLSCRSSHGRTQLAQGWIRPDTRSSCLIWLVNIEKYTSKTGHSLCSTYFLEKLAAKRDRCCISTNFELALH